MENKNFTVLFILIAMLAVCILLMGISLLMSERVFGQVSSYLAIACIVVSLVGVVVVGQVSSYLAIACIVVSLVGVVVVVRSNRKNKNKDDKDK